MFQVADPRKQKHSTEKTEGLVEVNSMWTKEIREIINRRLSDFKPVTTSTKKRNALDHRSGLSQNNNFWNLPPGCIVSPLIYNNIQK